MRRSSPLATVLALLLAAWLAPAALACTVEGGPFPLSSQVLDRATLAVEGTVISATGGVEAPVVIEISVERVLKGAASDDSVIVHDWGNCPFRPAARDRVVVAATADGGLTGAWLVDGDAAQEWIPTDPQLNTTAAIYAAFGVPDTATLVSEPPATTGGSRSLLLLAIWAVSALGLALIPRSRKALR